MRCCRVLHSVASRFNPLHPRRTTPGPELLDNIENPIIVASTNLPELPRKNEARRTRSRSRLTATMVEALRPKKRRYEVTDPAASGLQIRVECSGTKYWLFRFYWHKARVRYFLGDWPAVSLASARETAIAAHQLLRKGIDPRRSGLTPRNARATMLEPTRAAVVEKNSVGFLAEEFIRLHIHPRRKQPEEVQRMLDRDVLPTWRDRDARTIKPREVIELLDSIVARHAPVMANHVASLLSQMFKFGVHRALIDTSPVQLLYRPGGKEKPRTRILSDAEIKSFLAKAEEACRNPRMPHVLKILLLTGQRRGELALAKWSDINFEAKTWRIPDENSKNGKGHVLPLSDWAIVEFRHLQLRAGRSPFVLPAENRKLAVNPKLMTRSVARSNNAFKNIGIDGFTIHDLRRTCRTGLARLRVPNDIAERVLNHAREGIEAVYDLHDYVEEKRVALDKWAAHLTTLSQPVLAA